MSGNVMEKRWFRFIWDVRVIRKVPVIPCVPSKRVHIPAGKTESVAIPLTGENFEWFDAESNTMRPLEGTYELLYGGTSDRNKLKTIVMNVQ